MSERFETSRQIAQNLYESQKPYLEEGTDLEDALSYEWEQMQLEFMTMFESDTPALSCPRTEAEMEAHQAIMNCVMSGRLEPELARRALNDWRDEYYG